MERIGLIRIHYFEETKGVWNESQEIHERSTEFLGTLNQQKYCQFEGDRENRK